MLKIMSESEYFDKYYPKQWGDWKVSYNIEAYRKHPNATGCTWLDYVATGYANSEIDGKLKINTLVNDDIIDRFFMECGSIKDEVNVAYFIQPALQHKDGLYFASVVARKLDSNLELYEIYVSGCDDSSFTKHFIGLYDLRMGLLDIKNYGIGVVIEKDQYYFFTN